jgi:hypothetical protein
MLQKVTFYQGNGNGRLRRNVAVAPMDCERPVPTQLQTISGLSELVFAREVSVGNSDLTA